MKGLQLIRQDLTAMWKHKHGRIALIFLALVPLIYSGLFLSGYWDPYGRVDELPVAVVNMDEGSIMDEKPIQAGDDFVANLKENKDLDYRFVAAENAEQGLENGKYYMVITIPKDFSANIGTLMEEERRPAKLLYTTNPGKNFVASQISSTAVEKMKTKISASVTKSYAEGVLSKFQDVSKGMSEAGEGADMLHQGVADAREGSVKVTDGLLKFANGVGKAQEGSKRLSESGQELAAGFDQVNRGAAALAAGMSELSQGTAALEKGAVEAAEGSERWSTGNQSLIQKQTEVNSSQEALKTQLQQFAENHPELKDDPGFQKITALSSGLADAGKEMESAEIQLGSGAEKISAGQAGIVQGIKTLSGKMVTAAESASKLSEGTDGLSDGFAEWNRGITSLKTGLEELRKETDPLQSGSVSLTDGLAQLTEGSGELSRKLKVAAEETAAVQQDDELTAMFSEPVKLVESNYSEVPNYGAGIAPYFLSLAFFVGGIMAANILPLGKREKPLANGTHHFLNKLGLVYTIGLIQALIVDAVVLLAFQLDVASVPLFILSSIIISFTFMTLILMLITVFGLLGKFLAVTLLVFQLATCGGTFPGELSFPFLSKVGQFLPMAHSLQGLQDVITLGDWSELQVQCWTLAGYLFAAGVITWFVSHLQHRSIPGETISTDRVG
ncbi:YhgE/Pip domain-containing protein [Bacillus salacetis]|uniref:YhgE/Pip domain-containing protein n=1 Tax=Bacillus salacetis TaxID=2315464 RepID=A0A3A1QNM9_9BACI|nr:YhgE/Pip domain-containing protein [Bacillus salacetis]RIW28450.1 YhgE/Pip domain-containing protein [Bacillus salacetis]